MLQIRKPRYDTMRVTERLMTFVRGANEDTVFILILTDESVMSKVARCFNGFRPS
jgi:hypothetical protein